VDDAALDLAAAVGPYFVVDRWTPDSGWRPLTDLVEHSEVVAERVESARESLAVRTGLPATEIEERATASIVFLGLAARLIGPAFACAVLADRVPDLRLDHLWWKAVAGGPWPIARSTSSDSTPAADGGLAAELDTRILTPIVAPLLESFARTYAISAQVMWGNVASSLGGALTMITAARPDRSEAAVDLFQRLLDSGSLHGTGDLDPARRTFVRRSCCLFYRVPGAGVCGDCVLDAPPEPA
jgi:ferric iron reductase protein FhuF